MINLFNVRVATVADLDRLTEIYNESVLEKFRTAHTRTFTSEERADWLGSHDASHPVFVCEFEGKVAGYLTLTPYRQGRGALRFTVEISYYVAIEMRGEGVAQSLFNHAFQFASEKGYKTFIAILLDRNIESRRFLEKNGFEQWGLLPGVADFDGEVCGHLYYGRKVLL